MIYLAVLFVPPLYFLLRKKFAAFLVNAVLYGIAVLFVLSIFGAFIAPFFWILAVMHAAWHVRKEMMPEHAEMIATEMAKKMMPAGAAPAPASLSCPACGKGITTDNAFCPACGASMKAALPSSGRSELQSTSAGSIEQWGSRAVLSIVLIIAAAGSAYWFMSRGRSATAVTTPSVPVAASVTQPAPSAPSRPTAVPRATTNTDRCYSGAWSENNPNDFRWNFTMVDERLRIARNDGFVSGLFERDNGVWRGALQWGNGSTSNDVVLYAPNSFCTEITTNQAWWFKR